MELAKCKLCGGEAFQYKSKDCYCNNDECPMSAIAGLPPKDWNRVNDDTPRVKALCEENHRLRVIMGDKSGEIDSMLRVDGISTAKLLNIQLALEEDANEGCEVENV